MTGLAGFSDWALALLPRLFLYPGGAWMLVMVLWLRLVSGGPKAVRPATLAADLIKASLPALAVGWASLALIPLPGVSALSAPVDRLVLVALILVSRAISEVSGVGKHSWIESCISAGITLALLAPLARGRSLLLTGGDGAVWNLSSVLSVLAVMAGLAALSTSAALDDLPGAARWLAWLGLGLAPVWASWVQPPLPGIYWVSLTYALAIVMLSISGRAISAYARDKGATIAVGVWVLTTLSLLAALLGY
jgi:hypothetical protein